MADSKAFTTLCEELERASSLDRLEARGTVRLALKQAAYALDSTTIDLCLALFPWARFRRRKGAVKLHTLIDLRGNIPCFIRITHGKTADVTVLDHLPIEPGAFYMMDKGYIDFGVCADHDNWLLCHTWRNIGAAARVRMNDKTTGAATDDHARSRPPSLSDPLAIASPRRRTPTAAVPHQQLHLATIAQLYRCNL
jgi:hypothetical protein